MSEPRHHEIVIIGGGTGGISIASHLKKEMKDLDVAVVEPSEHHYY